VGNDTDRYSKTQAFHERNVNMSAKQHTFVKSRAAETKVLHLLVFLGILGSTWLTHHYDIVKLALFEIHILVP